MIYLGYIEKINTEKMKKDAVKLLDQDGDGDLDETDLQLLWKKVASFLRVGASFWAGFFVSLRFL